jgi:hypothetical protein
MCADSPCGTPRRRIRRPLSTPSIGPGPVRRARWPGPARDPAGPARCAIRLVRRRPAAGRGGGAPWRGAVAGRGSSDAMEGPARAPRDAAAGANNGGRSRGVLSGALGDDAGGSAARSVMTSLSGRSGERHRGDEAVTLTGCTAAHPTRRGLSYAAYARVGRIARRATPVPVSTSRARGPRSVASDHQRERSVLNARRTTTLARPRPPSLQGLWSFVVRDPHHHPR